MIDKSFWSNKNILITGHSGFKGSWLTRTLLMLGANVTGFSDKPMNWNSKDEAKLYCGSFTEIIGDITVLADLENVFENSSPSIIFHLAAQSLVINGYNNPIKTFSENVVGTVSVLEAAKKDSELRAFISVTSDKCYENKEWTYSYREIDRLGGIDPYSASKACAEIATNAMYQSYFKDKTKAEVATVRAGNVIGGMDWSANRLIPDFYRALRDNQCLELRFPNSTRPWQFVMEPLIGYLMLAEAIYLGLCQQNIGWNFGPNNSSVLSVGEVISHLNHYVDNRVEVVHLDGEFHEANLLAIDSSKAASLLGWQPKISIQKALKFTSDWYNNQHDSEKNSQIIYKQIESFVR